MKTELLSNGTLKLTIEAQSRFDKLVESKLLGGLTREQAESAATQQIERDLGIVRRNGPELDYDEKVATAGANANASQVATRGTAAEVTPVEVHFHENKFVRKTVGKPAKA